MGNVNGAMMKPCRSFKLTYVELISLAGVLNVYLQAAGKMLLLWRYTVLQQDHTDREADLRSPQLLPGVKLDICLSADGVVFLEPCPSGSDGLVVNIGLTS